MTENPETPKDWAQEIEQVRDRLEQLRDDVPAKLIEDEDIKEINMFLSVLRHWADEVRDKQGDEP